MINSDFKYSIQFVYYDDGETYLSLSISEKGITSAELRRYPFIAGDVSVPIELTPVNYGVENVYKHTKEQIKEAVERLKTII